MFRKSLDQYKADAFLQYKLSYNTIHLYQSTGYLRNNMNPL